MNRKPIVVLILHVLIMFEIPARADQWGDCSEGSEATIVYRTVNPGQRGDGKLWCCDYVSDGTASTTALETCKDVYEDCVKVNFDEITLDEWSGYFKENYLAVGESAVENWRDDNNSMLEQCENTFEAPNQELREKIEMVSVFPDMEACINPGTAIGNIIFLGACESGNNIYVSTCNIKLRKPVVRRYSPDQFWVALANALQNEQTAEQFREAIEACKNEPVESESSDIFDPVDQSIDESIDQSNEEDIYQSIDDDIDQVFDEDIYQSIDDDIDQVFDEDIDQSIDYE
ncbi:MAG: hypothetical protein JXA04_10835 [Gammaproteobacteria bacterium]|nr:hypothetical protein [Gammaproteobacteria bacterium]